MKLRSQASIRRNRLEILACVFITLACLVPFVMFGMAIAGFAPIAALSVSAFGGLALSLMVAFALPALILGL